MRRLLDRVALRMRSLLRGAHADASLQREIDQHIDELAAENVGRGKRSGRQHAWSRNAATRGASRWFRI